MLQTYQIAKLIEKELNNNINATAMNLKFKIHNSVGNYQKALAKPDGKKQRIINGVLRSISGEYTPVRELNNLDISLMLEFTVSQNEYDSDVVKVQLVLDSWSESVLGNVYGFDKTYQMLMTPQPAVPGQARNMAPLGSAIPLSVVLDIQLIRGGLISNAVQWKINGIPVFPTNASINFNRNPDVVPKANQNISKANTQYETRAIILVLPLSYTDIMKTLMNDLLSGNKDAIYKISRSDGFCDDYEEDCVLTNADENEEGGKIVALDLTFAPADDDEEE